MEKPLVFPLGNWANLRCLILIGVLSTQDEKLNGMDRIGSWGSEFETKEPPKAAFRSKGRIKPCRKIIPTQRPKGTEQKGKTQQTQRGRSRSWRQHRVGAVSGREKLEEALKQS